MAKGKHATIIVKADRRKELFSVLEKRIRDALELCGQQAERNAKINLENDPRRIDTGMLRNSITHAYSGEPTAIKAYSGDNPSHYNDTGIIPHGAYSGNAPEEAHTMFVGTNVEYALHVHEGTANMAPNRYLRNAIEGHEAEYKAIIEKVLKG